MSHKRKEVEIKIDAGEINYSAALLRAHPGHKIHWWSDAGPFAIQFAGISPVNFGGGRSGGGRVGPYSLVGTVRRGAVPGAYRYACALVVDNQVHLDAGCPEIIIDTDGQS